MIVWILLIIQGIAVVILLGRLLSSIRRLPPVKPLGFDPRNNGKVSIIIPTLNEAERITPCLEGLIHQGPAVREILVVDSNSSDGTREIVKEYSRKDPRIKLLTDESLPEDWVGRPWALHHGYKSMSSDSTWFLGIDADTHPQKGMVSGILKSAEKDKLDMVSFSPQFILLDPGEMWLQPALLVTLIYRFGAPGTGLKSQHRTMANGQLFLTKKTVLDQVNGYESAHSSFCDDVTLARKVRKRGFRVSFLDGQKIYKVRMYEGMRETWREWGRSLDLKDASTFLNQIYDLYILFFTQFLPLIILIFGISIFYLSTSINISLKVLLGLNLFLFIFRYVIQFQIKSSYDLSRSKAKWVFWLSPFADPFAFLRILISTFSKPKSWRGRMYQ